MAPRKTHKKTRSGCVQCKRRKVKCGEEDCPCNNCAKRGLTCIYVQPRPISTPDSNTRSPRSHDDTSRQPGSDARIETQDLHAGLNRQEELCLVHYYITSTYMGANCHENDADVWRNLPFHDGLTYPFVLDAVLALAALHKSYNEPQHSKKYMSACLYYQSQCLQAYQKQLPDINQDNCHAMFAVSALINVLAIAMARGDPSLLPTPSVETLFTTFKLLRGIQVVLHDTFETVKSAHYKEIFEAPSLPPDAVVSSEVLHAMEELRRLAVERGEPTKSHPEVYTTSIDTLEDHFRQVEQGHNFGAVISWPIALDEKALEMLKTSDPMMMLIFVHYGVLHLHIHQRWWAHNFGCRLIWELSESLHALDASWLPLTSWARSKAAEVRSTPVVY